MLPEGWSRRTLGEIAQITSGGTPDRAKPDYWGGNIHWVTTGEIRFNTITDTAEKITEHGLKNSSAKLLPPGTLLMAMYGQGKTRGQVAKLGIEASTNQACSAILLKDLYDIDFYFHYLASHYAAIRKLGNAGTQQNLSGGIIKELTVPVPPFNEQRRIARVLGTWDEAIATSERLLANSRKQKQALMQQLLTARIRLRGYSRPWRTYRLGDLFSERVEAGREDLPLLSITRDEGVISRGDVGRKDTSNEDKSKYRRICPKDIGYNTMRMWQGVSALSNLEGIVSPAYTVVSPNDLIDGRFTSYLFKLNSVISKFYRHSQGLVSDTWNLKFPHFAAITVTIPERSEQEAIVHILSTADKTIGVLAQETERRRLEKRVLMAQLLTGKRRVHQSGSPAKASA